MKFPWNKQSQKDKKDTKKLKEMTAADYEKLGRAVEQVYVMGYATPLRLMLMSIYRGIGYGFGIFIGGTIVVALIAWTIAQFESIDILKPVIESVRTTVQEVNGGPVLPPTN